MAEPVTINLRHVARGLEIPLPQIQAVVELLDEGNTVPFITRYRKDRTGGLDEEQVREIQARLLKSRLLAERKTTILRSIEAQGKLTEKLTKQIQAATTTKRLEDLYLPFKPKKQTLATLARSRGLELLASEILEAASSCADLDRRAADFANPDRQVPTAADALLGAGHILAEQFSERADLRHRLREILQKTGKLVSSQLGAENKLGAKPEPVEKREKGRAAAPVENLALPNAEGIPADEPQVATWVGTSDAAPTEVATPDSTSVVPDGMAHDDMGGTVSAEAAAGGPGVLESNSAVASAAIVEPTIGLPPLPPLPHQGPEISVEWTEQPGAESVAVESLAAAEPPATEAVEPLVAAAETWTVGDDAESMAVLVDAVAPPETRQPPVEILLSLQRRQVHMAHSTHPRIPSGPVPKPKPGESSPVQTKAAQRLSKKELKKKKLDERRHKAFSDYFDYSEDLRKIPPHRILAINRGERAKVLRVRIECDMEAMTAAADEACVPAGHPHADFLRGCARDALARLIFPSLDREVRREQTERAEAHAVGVFARNLRNLLLQPPVRDRRILAIDPGYKNGCKVAALDEFGNVLEHALFFLIGKPERREEAKQLLTGLIEKHQVTALVIGNGSGCREAEDFVGELLANELKDKGLSYVIVNEAGASVYSTSRLGREELPGYDASLRGAISIGRRLQDPLSELVKIEPANIGVGLYQHDVKAKHLQSSLDDVVESCVNYVGVDLNTASAALLRYVSGLNQLTARRLYEHRQQNGPFRNREQLKEVPGFGEATFVQAAGFLKIVGGDNPLDATWIHPESYEIASRVMAKLNCTPADLAAKEAGQGGPPILRPDFSALAVELQVGTHLLRDILAQLSRPGRDPREDLPPPVFKRGVLKLEDLTPGMELTGTVLNVVDFGAFVDIGMHDSGLVHVSQLADRFVRDPHEVVAVGDIVRVWVVDVDKQRRRVSLTMVRPGSHRGGPRQRPEGAAAEGGVQTGRPQGSGEPQGRPPRPPRRGEQQGRPQGQGRSQGPGRPQGPGRGRPGGPPPPRGGGQTPRQFQPKSRPKPIVPLSEEMKAGKAPMRTFGDLMQFFELKQPPSSKPPVPPKKPKPPTVDSSPEIAEKPPEITPPTPPAEPAPPVQTPPEEPTAITPPVPPPPEPPAPDQPQ